MAEQTRSSVMALMAETTEGTPVIPASATDFIPLQDGFDFDPAFDVLENAELKASIGKAKPVIGLEKPKASFSAYVKHSGTEGEAPMAGPLFKSVFGSENAIGTERTTAAASTTSLVKLAAGGTDYARGRALLIKDGTNGYSIRPVDSVSTNDLTLGFSLSAAPAAGITCGKAVTYAPANTGHPSLTVWEYRANGGAVEAIAGARVTSFSMEVSAGQMINGSFGLDGVKYYFNPIEITSSTNKLDFTDDNGTVAATIPVGMYRDPHELAAAVTDAMNTANGAQTATCVYQDADGKFKITSTGTVLSLLFATGANTANTIATKLGFTATDKTGTAAGTGYTSSALSWAAPYTPSYDSTDPLVAKDNEVLLGGSTDITSVRASKISISINNAKADIEDVTSSSGISGSVIQERTSSIQITALLTRHDASKFKRFRANDETKFLFNFGTKSGGNWVAGKCASFYVPTCTITKHKMVDVGGLVALEMELQPFVDSSGNGEMYLNFV